MVDTNKTFRKSIVIRKPVEDFKAAYGSVSAANNAIKSVLEASGIVSASNSFVKAAVESVMSQSGTQIKQIQEAIISASGITNHLQSTKAFKQATDIATGKNRNFQKDLQHINFRPQLDVLRSTKYIKVNYAKERIEKLNADKKEIEHSLPIGKAVRVLVSFGRLAIDVIGLKARDFELIEVTGACNGEKVSLSIHYQKIEFLLVPYNLAGMENPTIH